MDISSLNGRWVLEAVEGKPVSEEKDIYFQIEGQTITGYDGCNRFGGSLSSPFVIRRSQRGCASEGISLPVDLTNPLPKLTASRMEGDQLVIPMPSGVGEATFKRK